MNEAVICVQCLSCEKATSANHFLRQYKWHRPHASLNLMLPISRTGLDIDVNNLLRHDAR
jgi:hypothetical protein